jgi:hypothetical protein
MEKNKKITLSLAIVMLIVTLFPWYSLDAGSMGSLSILGITTLMGFISFLIALFCIILVVMKKKIGAIIFGVIAVLVSLISMVLNSVIFGIMAEALNKTVKTDQWSKHISFGGTLFLLISVVFIIMVIKKDKTLA